MGRLFAVRFAARGPSAERSGVKSPPYPPLATGAGDLGLDETTVSVRRSAPFAMCGLSGSRDFGGYGDADERVVSACVGGVLVRLRGGL